MSNKSSAKDDFGKELPKAVRALEATERDVDYFVAEITDRPDKQQRRLLEDLNRLLDSLRGPEELLDGTSYSRPFPPRPHRHPAAGQREEY
jgi:hypothetical protein